MSRFSSSVCRDQSHPPPTPLLPLFLLISVYMCMPDESIHLHLLVVTNRVLLFLLLSVYVRVPNGFVLLHLYVETVSNRSLRLCPGRAALRDNRLQDNSDYLHVAISRRRKDIEAIVSPLSNRAQGMECF